MSWLIHRTGITRGAAVGHTAWARRVARHPRVVAALAAGQVPESAGRLICLWTDKLPPEYRDAADEQLLAASAGGLGLADLAGLFAEMYVRARGDLPDQDPGRDFADREVKLATTIGGAGVLHGDLTGECAAAVAAVLDALSAPAGAEDDRSKGQRYHDALAEAMRWLVKCIVTSVTPSRYGCGTCDRLWVPKTSSTFGSDQQPQPLAARFRYHGEEGRDPGPARPVQVRAARLPLLQDGELVAQDQDLGGLSCLLAPGQPQPGGRPRDEEEDEPQAHDR